jgi:Flp pilus assembly protein TadG
MYGRSQRRQRGQAIVLIALMIVVLFGMVGLAIDSGRAYLDRRHLQAAADAAALGAAYTYMNTADYSQSEQIAVNTYADDEELYGPAACAGLGTTSVSCTFSGDASGQVMTIVVTNKSIAGVSFRVTGTGSMPVAIMQVLGSGPNITVGATATALARKAGTNGAAIQTLSPAGCGGNNGNSLTFTGTSTTNVTGDVWSNGSITDNGQASGTINGNAIDICPPMPPSPMPNFTVTGTQANGWTMLDPGFPEPSLNTNTQTWNSTNGSVEQPGTYTSDPKLSGGAGCYFLAGGVYTWSAGFTQNGGFVSNELRPPDEPNLASAGQPNVTTTTAAISAGGVSSIPVSALSAAIPGSTTVSVGNQIFTVDGGGAAAGATSINLAKNQSATSAIPSGSWLSVRALPQFWDSNKVGCGTTFTLATANAGTDQPVNPQTWAVELTAVRWEPYGVSSCGGPGSTTCFLRESPPSMCKTVTVGSGQIFKVSVTSSPPDPGAQDFNLYLAPSGSCQGPFGYAATFANSGSYGMNITGGTLNGWALNSGAPLDNAGAPAPDYQALPVASGLPNANPRAGTPPHGDLANEGHCVDPTTGNSVACPAPVTPGAVIFFIPGGGNTSTCLNLQGGGDIYVFSGYQYKRILLYEPGPEQQPPPNSCLNNVAGSGITSLIGIFYIPAAGVTIIGNSSYLATIAGGVIAWTATVKGNGGVSISADPTLRTWPPSVTLTQ